MRGGADRQQCNMKQMIFDSSKSYLKYPEKSGSIKVKILIF